MEALALSISPFQGGNYSNCSRSPGRRPWDLDCFRPFGRGTPLVPRRIMTNRYVQLRLIRPTLQFHLPQPKAVAITAPAISTNQHPLRLGIKGVAHLSPPTANALHGETRRVMGTAYGVTSKSLSHKVNNRGVAGVVMV